MILVISLVTLATMTTPGLELKMAHNRSLQTQALAASEDGLGSAETLVDSNYNGVPTFDFDLDSEDCLYNGVVDPAVARRCNTDHSVIEPDEDPTAKDYYVEYLGPQPLEFGSGTALTDRYYFRINGSGRTGTSARQVQSIFVTRGTDN
jgi:hypothetical protein